MKLFKFHPHNVVVYMLESILAFIFYIEEYHIRSPRAICMLCILSMIEFNVFCVQHFFLPLALTLHIGIYNGGGDTHVYYYFVSRFCISESSSYMQRLWFGCLRNVGNRKKFYFKNICFFPSTFRRLYSQRGGLICGRIGQSHYFVFCLDVCSVVSMY